MKRKYKPVIRILALIMVIVCLCVSLAPASFAFAGVLDPGAWLYPIWSIYGAANGVDVTSQGGADFTINGMTSLWNEYQSYRVSQDFQQAAQSISDFVDGAKSLVTVVANTVAGSTLGTKLQIGSTLVGALTAFWNWIIKIKLGGTSVDSTDFDASSGNLAYVSSAFVVPYYGTSYPPNMSGAIQISTYLASPGFYQAQRALSYGDNVPVYCFYYLYDNAYHFVYCAASSSCGVRVTFERSSAGSVYALYEYNTASNMYYRELVQNPYGGVLSNVSPSVPGYDTLYAGLSALSSGASGGLTVAPDAGIDILGFPDASDQDYVPADAVIPWNVPYDQTKDTLDYIDAAFADAVTNDLEIGQNGEVVQPVPGVGPIGDYVAPGLGDVFPFCIPFDIYDFLSALAADPVAPSFTAELAFPEAVGGSQYVELDFDTPMFNQLASILRTMELLAFIVGLALLTRSMFIRG